VRQGFIRVAAVTPKVTVADPAENAKKIVALAEDAAKNGADVVISADFKHHILALALETGLAVIQLTHYASENYGFENYYRKIRKQAGIPCVFHTDEALL